MFLARKKKMERELLAVLKWHVAICIYNAREIGVENFAKISFLFSTNMGQLPFFAKESFVISIFLSIFQNHILNMINVLF